MNTSHRRDAASLLAAPSRRDLLRALGVGVAASAAFVGCATRRPAKSGTAATIARRPWATGGTKALRGHFEDPFGDVPLVAGAAALTCAKTLGPCHARSLARRDISEGQGGLPTRLAFRLVDAAGQPIEGAELDVWHASPRGVYSGDDAIAMCTNEDTEAVKARYFRGLQSSDAQGRVSFETCLPGWYHGRAVHIHFTVRVGGKELLTTQLGFDDAFLDEVLTTQPIYAATGTRDTRNTEDGILGGDLESALFETRQTEDGALLAYKTVVLRRSIDEKLCGDGDRGPGGPPPGGFGSGGRPPGPPPGGFGGRPPGPPPGAPSR